MQLVVTGCDAWPVTNTLVLVSTEENTLRNVNLYPNPNKGQFSISLPEEDCEIDIINSLGQVVYHQSQAKGTTSLHLESLNSGMYFVTVKSAHAVNTLKFVKE